jgi:hypothetical protein
MKIDDLARFGYRLNMKVEKNRILLFSWLPTGTYHENVANLGQFFHGKSFV